MWLRYAATSASYAATAANARAAKRWRVSAETCPWSADLLQHGRVVGRVADDRDPREVARRGADRSDVPPTSIISTASWSARQTAADLRRERADVDDDEVDRADVLLDEAGHVGLDLAARHDPGVDLRVERLDLSADERRHRR